MNENGLCVKNNSVDPTKLLQEHQHHDNEEWLPVDIHSQHGLERDIPNGLLSGQALLHDLELLGSVVVLPPEPLQRLLCLLIFLLGQQMGWGLRHEEHDHHQQY